ncbi:MAG: DUF3520 domain-containing protein, partial [Planctomycetota bacterium]|nr:DUF3520 domain-containing protein [Planctomycetota bacterium]
MPDGKEETLLRKDIDELTPSKDESKPDAKADSAEPEVAKKESEPAAPAVDPLKYRKPLESPKLELTDAAKSGELLTLKLRYKDPGSDTSKPLDYPVKDSDKKYGEASKDFKFASAVAAFGMILRHSAHDGNITLPAVKELAQEGL